MLSPEGIVEYLIQSGSTVGKKKLGERIRALVESQQLDTTDPKTASIVEAIAIDAVGVCGDKFDDLINRTELLYQNLSHNLDVTKTWISRCEEAYNKAQDPAREVRDLTAYFSTEIQNARRLLPAMHEAVRSMEAALKRYEKLKSFPNSYATSLAKKKWVCSECNTELGKVDLYGLASGEWSRMPVYCPGCGAKTPYGEPFNGPQDIQSVNYRGFE